MKNIINRIKNDKVLFFLSILIIGVFLVLVIRITYSYLAAFINEARENVTLGSDTTDEFKFIEGETIDLNVTSTTLPEGGGNYAQSTTYRAELTANSTNNTAEESYYVYFNIIANTLGYIQEGNPEVILTVFQDDTEITNIEGLTYGTYNGVTGFDVTTATGMFTVASDYAITSNSSTDATVQNWTFTLTYLNQNYDQSGNYGNNMNVEIIMTKEKTVTFADTCRETGSNTLACHVATQYTGTDGENGLYYHDGSFAQNVCIYNNNFVFNDYTLSTNSIACQNVYRDGEIYIDSSIVSTVSWNSSNNICENESGNEVSYDLNGSYGVSQDECYGYARGGRLVSFVGSGKMQLTTLDANDNSYRYAGASADVNNYVCFGDDCSNEDNLYRIIGVFDGQVKLIKATSYGDYAWESDGDTQGNTWDATIKPDIYTTLNDTYYNTLGSEWQNKISTHSWKVGGLSNKYRSYSSFKTIYDYEVGVNQTGYEETMKIGLMYVSDYIYASNSNHWTERLDYYGYFRSGGAWIYWWDAEWTISRTSEFSFFAWSVVDMGFNVDGYNVVNYATAVRPSFYLNSSVNYVSGSGTETDPIVIN